MSYSTDFTYTEYEPFQGNEEFAATYYTFETASWTKFSDIQFESLGTTEIYTSNATSYSASITNVDSSE